MKILTCPARVFSSQTVRNTSRIGGVTGHYTFESFFNASFVTHNIQIIIAINVNLKSCTRKMLYLRAVWVNSLTGSVGKDQLYKEQEKMSHFGIFEFCDSYL